MNKLLFNILFACLFYQISFVHSENEYRNSELVQIKCAPQLQNSLNKIQKIPEARRLIASIQKESPIQIIAKDTSLSNQFGAFWDPDRRVICISLSSHATEGSIIGSILFELHNASVNAKFDHLEELVIQGKIDKASYVRSMEYLEYMNSLNAAKIAEKGIQMKVLPPDSRLPTYRSFNEHFSEQQKSGHSACFARIYDSLRQEHSYRIQ